MPPLQEKNKLIKDIKQLKAHYEKYEPTIAALKRKYESATREKSLASIERDRLAQALKSLQARLEDQEDKVGDTIKGPLLPRPMHHLVFCVVLANLAGGFDGTHSHKPD